MKTNAMDPRGFTMVELIVALVMFGVVSAAIYQMLVSNQRIYTQQTQQVDMNANLRAAVALLPSELRELNSGDPLGSDIVVLAGDSIIYKAMRSLYIVCAPPLTASPTEGTVIVSTNPAMVYGIRDLEATRDSILLFAEMDPNTRADNVWLHAAVSGGVALGTACADGGASMTINLRGINPAVGLVGVENGAPLRSYEVVKLKTYRDALGDTWLGMQQFQPNGGWLDVQPVLGPLAPGGFQLAYFDANGNVTADRTRVVRIQVTVVGRTRMPVRRGGAGSTNEYVQDTLVTQVALRN